MEVLKYFELADPEIWLNKIAQCPWRAGQYLSRLLSDGSFRSIYGPGAELLLLAEEDRLISFCTYSMRDEIDAPVLFPWVGFVYTFPEERGRRRIGKLIEQAWSMARDDHARYLYLSTDQQGIYEHFGFHFWKNMTTMHGDDTLVYRMEILPADTAGILGRHLTGTIDRPIGSRHPDYPDMIYPINYGYADGIPGGDGENQDVYVFGTDQPLEHFAGTVVGICRRLNDCEDKWIVSLNGQIPAREEVLRRISFQEQYYMSELIMMDAPR